jgi:hypothetical protein
MRCARATAVAEVEAETLLLLLLLALLGEALLVEFEDVARGCCSRTSYSTCWHDRLVVMTDGGRSMPRIEAGLLP